MNFSLRRFRYYLIYFALFNILTLTLFLKPESYDDHTNIEFPAIIFNPNETRTNVILNSKDTIFYTDAWRSHWCTYYNDREYFLTPRINEFENLLRSRGFRVMHLNWKGDELNRDKQMRESFRILAKKGMTETIEKLYPDPNKEMQNYIPTFSDQCMYSNHTRFGPTRNQRPNYALSLSENDLIAFNFKSVAAISSALNVKSVVILGMHTNLCIYNVATLLKASNISLGFVTDLLDAGYYYPSQKKTVQSHSQQNNICNNYIGMKFGWLAVSYDIYRALLSKSPTSKEPKWLLYPNVSKPFKRSYMPT